MTKVGTIVKIREYRDKGLTKKATARRLGLDRKTVAKYWEGPADDPEKPRYRRRPRLTDPYEEYITDHLVSCSTLFLQKDYRQHEEWSKLDGTSHLLGRIAYPCINP